MYLQKLKEKTNKNDKSNFKMKNGKIKCNSKILNYNSTVYE